MMSNKVAFICTIILILYSFFPIQVNAKQIKSEDESVLILYDNQISKQNINNVKSLVRVLAYQNYSVVYGDVSEYIDTVDSYSHIICYDLDKQEYSLISKLADSNSNLMIIGNTLIEGFLPKSGFYLWAKKGNGKVGKITYSFSSGKEVTSLIKVTPYFLEGAITYESGNFKLDEKQQGVCIGNDNLRYFPTTDIENELVKSILSVELAHWMRDSQEELYSYGQYIVFDKVYPFTDINQMIDVVDIMKETKTPFVISVMPIYQNVDHPSMKRFCEVLRYAEANGGAVILHNPVMTSEDINVEELQNHLTVATEAYSNYGVYPLAIEVPSEWLFHEQGQEILKRYSTVMVYDENLIKGKEDLTTHKDSMNQVGHQIISPAISLDGTGSSYINVYPTAVYKDITEDVETLRNDIAAYKESIVPIQSLWEISHVVDTDTSRIVYENRILTYNDVPVDLTYEPFAYVDSYDYKRNILTRITVDLESQNKKLIIFVSAAIVLFIFFILHARISNRKKFFYPKEK